MYQVIDSKTGQVMSEHKTLKAAHRKADKLDLQYGACRYSARILKDGTPATQPAPAKTREQELAEWRTPRPWLAR